MELSTEKIWGGMMAALKLSVSGPTYNTYLRPTRLLELTDMGERMVAQVGCGSAYVKNFLETRLWGQMASEMEGVVGKKVEIVFKIESRPSSAKTSEGQASLGPLFEEKKKDPETGRRANLRSDYTFENYAVGGSNQMAFAAAQAVARKLGTAYNPLFIYGGVGVGKTHLMQSIGHEVLESGETRVLFCPGEEFTNDLVEAIRFKSTDKVRTKYRKVKLLLIDDVQFIAGKPSVQEEFFHTYNALQREGSQIVMTSDKSPSEIAKLEPRLRSRFGAGLIVDIGQPDFEMRTAILLIKAKQKSFDLPMKLAQMIAENIEGVRELEGFLVRLKTETETNTVEVSEDLVEKLLNVKKGISGERKIVNPNMVMNTVGNYFGVGIQQLKGERRLKTIVWPRQILMYLLRNELELPFEEVGRLVGGRDHSTVVHGENKVKSALIDDIKTQETIGEIRKRLWMTS